ncbi:pollen-specific leucine-rich repeat extensin-like protein 2 [Herpailurus yagouaroundi]|uniref:pollen-specific leucine-rich repeat extensin-like protein 2 n=1 Tax=Herpailurus yagouaroundi TaxID=1608482 RepID=UPI001AD7AC92|nr:pollen-specific leucine-rich repeat extensin-like protein 2 [Puma yagouaroundi]
METSQFNDEGNTATAQKRRKGTLTSRPSEMLHPTDGGHPRPLGPRPVCPGRPHTRAHVHTPGRTQEAGVSAPSAQHSHGGHQAAKYCQTSGRPSGSWPHQRSKQQTCFPSPPPENTGPADVAPFAGGGGRGRPRSPEPSLPLPEQVGRPRTNHRHEDLAHTPVADSPPGWSLATVPAPESQVPPLSHPLLAEQGRGLQSLPPPRAPLHKPRMRARCPHPPRPHATTGQPFPRWPATLAATRPRALLVTPTSTKNPKHRKLLATLQNLPPTSATARSQDVFEERERVQSRSRQPQADAPARQGSSGLSAKPRAPGMVQCEHPTTLARPSTAWEQGETGTWTTVS